MPYSEKALRSIHKQLKEMPRKAAALREAFVFFKYQHARARIRIPWVWTTP
jgi:hypothetical protein